MEYDEILSLLIFKEEQPVLFLIRFTGYHLCIFIQKTTCEMRD